MSILDQQPRIATAEDLKLPWSGGKNGKYFRCYLCGHKFIEGDYYRFIFSKEYSNFFTCKECDSENVLEKWKKLNEEFKEAYNGRFWHFIIPEIDSYKDDVREIIAENKNLNSDLKEIGKFTKEIGKFTRRY